MAYKNKTVYNPKTHQKLTFVQTTKDTGGALLEMQATFEAHSVEPAAHYHPHQEEDFVVISGELTVRIDGGLKVIKEGESIHIPKGKIHSMWNDNDAKAVVNWKVQPAMNTEYFLETAYGLAKDGKTNEQGMPGLLQVAVMANKFTPEFRLAKPPYFILKTVFTILSPFAYMAGYKSTYQKYFK